MASLEEFEKAFDAVGANGSIIVQSKSGKLYSIHADQRSCILDGGDCCGFPLKRAPRARGPYGGYVWMVPYNVRIVNP